MKFFKILIVLFIGFIFLHTGCIQNNPKNQAQNYLSKAQLTPGTKEKEVSLFLYLIKKEVDYTTTIKGEENSFLLFNLNDTIKAKNLDKLSVDGIDNLVESARVIQVVEKNDKKKKKNKNNLITRITFKLKDPETTIKPIIQVEEVSAKTYNEAKNAAESSTELINILKKPDKKANNAFVYGFWVLIIAILFIVAWQNKKKQPPASHHEVLEETE